MQIYSEGGTVRYWCTYAWTKHMWKGVFFFAVKCIAYISHVVVWKSWIFKKNVLFCFCNLSSLWVKFDVNSAKSLFRGVFWEKAKTCLGDISETYVHALFTNIPECPPSVLKISSMLWLVGDFGTITVGAHA